MSLQFQHCKAAQAGVVELCAGQAWYTVPMVANMSKRARKMVSVRRFGNAVALSQVTPTDWLDCKRLADRMGLPYSQIIRIARERWGAVVVPNALMARADGRGATTQQCRAHVPHVFNSALASRAATSSAPCAVPAQSERPSTAPRCAVSAPIAALLAAAGCPGRAPRLKHRSTPPGPGCAWEGCQCHPPR